jgi:DNA-binding LacI/PurR family transcriptional regulator
MARRKTTQRQKPGLGGRSVKILMALREELDRGVYPPGSKLPTERELCRRFKASRPTIYRAISNLVEEGRVVVRWGAGMFVRTSPQLVARSKTIAVMFPFTGEALSDIQSLVLHRGHLMCAFSQFQTQWDPKAERLFLERVRDEGHKALLAFCSPLAPHNDDILRSLALSGIRVIHLEPYTPEPPEQSYLMPDYRQGGYTAAVELLLRGGRNLHFVTSNFNPDPNLEPPYIRELEAGFREGIARHAGDEAGLTRANVPLPEIHDGVIARLLETAGPAAGFFCTSAELASAIRDAGRGRKSPRVIGFAFTSAATHVPPATDLLLVERMPAIERAIERALAPEWKEIRELIPPRLTRAARSGGAR